jgi:hypothetical protein
MKPTAMDRLRTIGKELSAPSQRVERATGAFETYIKKILLEEFNHTNLPFPEVP